MTNYYITKEDLADFERITELSTKQLVREITKMIMSDGDVTSQQYVQALRKQLKMQYEIPESYTRSFLISCGNDKDELAQVKRVYKD